MSSSFESPEETFLVLTQFMARAGQGLQAADFLRIQKLPQILTVQSLETALGILRDERAFPPTRKAAVDYIARTGPLAASLLYEMAIGSVYSPEAGARAAAHYDRLLDASLPPLEPVTVPRDLIDEELPHDTDQRICDAKQMLNAH